MQYEDKFSCKNVCFSEIVDVFCFLHSGRFVKCDVEAVLLEEALSSGVCSDQSSCLFSLHWWLGALCLSRIEIWIGLSTFSSASRLSAPLLQLLFVI